MPQLLSYGSTEAHVTIAVHKPTYPADARYSVRVSGAASLDPNEVPEFSAGVATVAAEVARLNNEADAKAAAEASASSF